MKLFLSTPCYGGVCLAEYAASIIGLQRVASQAGVSIILDTTENESLVHRARNISIARFLYKSDADYFMFIDADIHFEPSAVLKLMEGGYDVTVAVYPKKCIMWDQVEASIRKNDNRNPERLSCSLVMNFKGETSEIVNGFTEVLDGPTGFMLIKRSVIEQMYKNYPELNCVNDHQNRDLETYCAIFDCMIDPDTRRYLSEDYAFCRRWQQIGGKIYAHCGVTLGHVGNLRFNGCLEERLKSLKSQKHKNERPKDSSHKTECTQGPAEGDQS